MGGIVGHQKISSSLRHIGGDFGKLLGAFLQEIQELGGFFIIGIIGLRLVQHPAQSLVLVFVFLNQFLEPFGL